MSLITVEQLAARLDVPRPDDPRPDDSRVRVIDVRWYLLKPGAGRAAYDAGHIPGARFLDLDADLSAAIGDGRHPLPLPADFARRLGGFGIGSDEFVVGYDDSGGTVAARLWWMLDNLGHRGGVAVLDGGLAAWTAAGLPLTSDEPVWPPTILELASEWSGVLGRDEVARLLGSVTLLDGRAPERYRGEVEPIDPAAGHIPTALNFPTAGNLASDGRFLPAAELGERFGALFDSGAPVVNSCGSGTTACHNALAMRLAGLPEPMLYVGSFSDWSTAGMPVVDGSEAGSADQWRESSRE